MFESIGVFGSKKVKKSTLLDPFTEKAGNVIKSRGFAYIFGIAVGASAMFVALKNTVGQEFTANVLPSGTTVSITQPNGETEILGCVEQEGADDLPASSQYLRINADNYNARQHCPEGEIIDIVSEKSPAPQ